MDLIVQPGDGLTPLVSAIKKASKQIEVTIFRFDVKELQKALESAVTRARARELLNGSRTEDAFSRFEVLERRADFAEGRADALGMTGPKSLEEEIAELKAADTVDAELEELKAALAARK